MSHSHAQVQNVWVKSNCSWSIWNIMPGKIISLLMANFVFSMMYDADVTVTATAGCKAAVSVKQSVECSRGVRCLNTVAKTLSVIVSSYCVSSHYTIFQDCFWASSLCVHPFRTLCLCANSCQGPAESFASSAFPFAQDQIPLGFKSRQMEPSSVCGKASGKGSEIWM